MPPNPIDEVALAERLTRIEEGQKNLTARVDDGFGRLRSDLARYLQAQQQDGERIRALETEQAQHCTAIANLATAVGEHKEDAEKRMDGLASRINSWSGINTVGAIIAGIIGWFK